MLLFVATFVDYKTSLLSLFNATETNDLSKANYAFVSLHTVLNNIWVFDYITARKPSNCKIVTLEVDIFSNEHLERFYSNPLRTFDVLLHPWAVLPDKIKQSSIAREFMFIPTFQILSPSIPTVSFEGFGHAPDPKRGLNTVFITSHPTDDRERILGAIEKHTEVTCLGRAYNNCGYMLMNSSSHAAWSEVFRSVLEIYTVAKYVLVIENVFEPGYVSEKLILAIRSGAVPIYFGAPDVGKYVDPSLYVQGDPSDPEAVVAKVVEYDRKLMESNGYKQNPTVNWDDSMSFRLNAQFNQDLWLNERFKHVTDGVFIDVGASDGKTINNTLFLEQRGWTGACVEPIKKEYDALVQNRTCKCYNACVYSSEGTVEFSEINKTHGFNMLSGITQHLSDKISTMMDKLNTFPGAIRCIRMPCITLATICHDLGDLRRVHFIKIDTEGSEYEILQGLDWDRVTVDVFCIECNDAPSFDKILEFMESKGYSLVITCVVDCMFERISK